MNTLVRLLVEPHGADPQAPEVRARYGIVAGWISIAVNVVLFALKLTLGIVVGSIALIADAVHTLTDVVSSAAVIIGFHISKKPGDAEHPFGHGRMEAVSALFVGVLLMAAALEFFKASVDRLFHPVSVSFSTGVLLGVAATIAVKEWLARFSADLGHRIGSKALIADASHHRTDAASSVLVLVALISPKLGLPAMDAVMGLLVSAMILYSGYDVVRDVVGPLLGEAPARDFVEGIRRVATTVQGVHDVHDIMVHNYGHVNFISLHVEIPENVPPMVAHEVLEKVENELASTFHAPCVAHYDPLCLAPELEPVRLWLAEAVQADPDIESYHDLRVVGSNGLQNLILDVVLCSGLSEHEEHEAARRLRNALLTRFDRFKSVIVEREPVFHQN